MESSWKHETWQYESCQDHEYFGVWTEYVIFFEKISNFGILDFQLHLFTNGFWNNCLNIL